MQLGDAAMRAVAERVVEEPPHDEAVGLLRGTPRDIR